MGRRLRRSTRRVRPVPHDIVSPQGGRSRGERGTMARVSTTERVFASLRESIVAGEFPAGSLHSIYRLADLLEVSRTPVREAVLRLADIGLVTIERNRGVRIRGVSVADVREVFELRLMIEVPAAAYAAAHADAETVATIEAELSAMRACVAHDDEAEFTAHDRLLHHAIGAATGNARLQAEVATLRDSIQARGASTISRSRDMADVAQEHAPIVAAISTRDPAAAAAHMEEHLVHTASLLMEQVATPGEDVVDLDWARGLRDHLYLPGRSASGPSPAK
ncbi:FCD domain-containing protein [Aeromicrobium yanjiei]|uniref:FCD domain-containing protein n=2 Tax=Aeromicrobium yanjiei TaxID=2662028 RepID=A0A5Q2MPN4_9ACTN|nr:FCD domain-containing protein [Aeromicrobium yanjiei]